MVNSNNHFTVDCSNAHRGLFAGIMVRLREKVYCTHLDKDRGQYKLNLLSITNNLLSITNKIRDRNSDINKYMINILISE